MTTSRIRFATDVLRRLGEELIQHPAAGIIELVKNAYDADARSCVVRLDATDDIGGTAMITDDGDGMTAADIKNGWLVIGQSQKAKRRCTRLGRIPAGSKGLGRLAALRLGTRARLETRPRLSRNSVFKLSINWPEFEAAALVDDVALQILRKRRQPNEASGTTIRLENIRVRLGKLEVRRLARAMLLLADPFADSAHGFQPNLVAPDFRELEELVRKRYFEEASFHLIGRIDSEGNATASVLDYKDQPLFAADCKELLANTKGQPYVCPPLLFDLWVFILNKTTFANRSSTVEEVRTWLGEFGGVHIYKNGIRVAPYGDPGSDWLGMNLSRVRSPEERPSTNTSIGRLCVTDSDETLVEKTDRSGFVETDTFLEVRRFATDCLEWMAAKRLEHAEQRRATARAEAPKLAKKGKERLVAAIASAPSRVRTSIMKAAEAYDRTRDREVDELRKEVQLYRTLSTAGITAATFAHEATGNPVKVIRTSLNTFEKTAIDLLGASYGEQLERLVSRIRVAVASLGVLDSATLSLLAHEKRRVARVDLHEVLRQTMEMFDPLLQGRKVVPTLDLADATPYLLASAAAIESIVTNLVNNSVVALEPIPAIRRRLVLRTAVDADTVTLTVIDSGLGIRDIRLSDIWLPGRTTRKNGTGLGLTIVRDTVVDLGGKVAAKEKGPLGGAEISVELPLVGARE